MLHAEGFSLVVIYLNQIQSLWRRKRQVPLKSRNKLIILHSVRTQNNIISATTTMKVWKLT